MKDITVDDVINGRVRKNDLVAYVYAKLENIELNKDTHGYYHVVDNERVYIKYSDMKTRLTGCYIRVGEDEWEVQ